MEEIAARAALVPAPDVGDGLTTSISRPEIEEVLAADEAPIELVLDVTRFADGETGDTRSISVSWERSDLEQLLKGQGRQVTDVRPREACGRQRRHVEDTESARRSSPRGCGHGGDGAAATAAPRPGAFWATEHGRTVRQPDVGRPGTSPVSATER